MGQTLVRELKACDFIFPEKNKEKAIKPHDRLVLVRSQITLFTRLTYQPGGLPGVFRDLRPGNNILG